MDSTLESGENHRVGNQPLRLYPGRGTTIHCIAGRIWITTAGLAADIFLEAGQSHVVRGYGLTLIEGEREGWIRLEDMKGRRFLGRICGAPRVWWQKTFSRTDRVASAPDWFA